MVKGVSEGYTIDLELIGVGYAATMQGELLELRLASRTRSSSSRLPASR